MGRTGGCAGLPGLTDVARLIESGELSPVRLTESMLDRIEAVDGRLHSYATLMAEHARGACGVSAGGPPNTIQFMGRALFEPALCRIGHAYEGTTARHTLHPDV